MIVVCSQLDVPLLLLIVLYFLSVLKKIDSLLLDTLLHVRFMSLSHIVANEVNREKYDKENGDNRPDAFY